MTAKNYSNSPANAIDTKKQYTATLKTDRGDLVLKLFTTDAPKTVNNFVFLAKDGYYDNTTFHRVISNFMVQGGGSHGYRARRSWLPVRR